MMATQCNKKLRTYIFKYFKMAEYYVHFKSCLSNNTKTSCQVKIFIEKVKCFENAFVSLKIGTLLKSVSKQPIYDYFQR